MANKKMMTSDDVNELLAELSAEEMDTGGEYVFEAADACLDDEGRISDMPADFPEEEPFSSVEGENAGISSETRKTGGKTSADFNVLRVTTEDLLTPTLLEASAGTGKTFSIKHLVLRLIVEHGMPIDRILVVTFTKAATAELKTRIREHLDEAYAYLCGTRTNDETESLLVKQVAEWRHSNRDFSDDALSIKRLKNSLARFDDASIFTIHGFCQKMLTMHAFSAANPFEFEVSGDDDELRSRVVNDFLRRALDRYEDNPDFRRKIVSVDWDGILARLRSVPATDNSADILSGKALAMREIRTGEDDSQTALLMNEFCRHAPAELERMKVEERVWVYDDLLVNVWKTIRRDASSGGAFVDSVRKSYDAVFVDEFQDTDPVQYAVFKMLFVDRAKKEEGKHALFFVGDPKQSIYSFRSADLNTYLRAREDIFRLGNIASLGTNFRSSPALVGAVNGYFGASENGNPFLNPKLKFSPVRASDSRIGLYRLEDGLWRAESAFELWWDPEGFGGHGALENAAQAHEVTAETVALDIKRLLLEASRGRIAVQASLGEENRGLFGDKETNTITAGGRKIYLRALEPGDIAILVRSVRSNERLRLLVRKLRALGVETRVQQQGTVFATPEAEEILLLLRAFANPSDERAVRAARATRIAGETLLQIVEDDERHRAELRQELEDGIRYWRRGGVAPVLSRFMTNHRAAARFLSTEGGEQVLTNVNHLIELLHEAGKTYNTPSGLIAWFENAMTDLRESDDEHIAVRLASDANLVTVYTIHKSKGLQFPVVYLPFGEQTGVFRTQKQKIYRINGSNAMKICINDQDVKPEDAYIEEEMAETVRMAYVAMTRASSKLILTYVPRMTKTGKVHSEASKSAYMQILSGEAVAPKAPSKRNAAVASPVKTVIDRTKAIGSIVDLRHFSEIKSRAEKCNIGEKVLVRADGTETPGADPSRDILSRWRTTSFSGIARMIEDDDENPVRYYAKHGKRRISDDIMDFPRGTKAGDTLHEIFELADFPEVAPDTPEAREKRLRLCEAVIDRHLSFNDSAEERDCAVRAAARMLKDVLNTEIAPGIRLSRVSMKVRKSEMPFLISLPKGLTAKMLGDWLESRNPRYAVRGLTDEMLSGYLTGFIDLAFGAAGKFWILDWKSNAIADRVTKPEDYTEAVMDSEMALHHYRLQYLIYLVALRRYLLVRLGEDAFRDDMIGGALYIFVRGVRCDALKREDGVQGVVFDPVDPAFVRDLDELFREEH